MCACVAGVHVAVLQITLIDKSDRFVFKPLLYELINGTAQSWEVAPTFSQLLAPYPIQFLQVRGPTPDLLCHTGPCQHLLAVILLDALPAKLPC